MIGQASLSLDQAPPISVPFRFFLTAPLFIFCAGLLLLIYGPDALISRWSPVTSALKMPPPVSRASSSAE